MSITLTNADWLDIFLQFLSLSLLAVGGPMSTAPDMHRYLVTQQHWLTEAQFSSSIALAQAAPGPNVLFVGLLGWNLGLNAAGGLGAGPHAIALALFGLLLAMTGCMLPALVLAYHASRWAQRHSDRRPVRAFKAGMAPLVVALMIATGWLLAAAHGNAAEDWRLWLLTLAATLIVWRTQVHLLWLIAAGALLGGLGWV
ncbi:chromate transporter [Brachymonas denitrificans]|jgi:chromate transporter|uniref:Chromate transporter n=1 Tax=Brachymonas denitrificans DSM 15123 TaxID=1121117 RepID=A0A1H8HB33_9BURK|nr:chromate transporter [Brachymonas denitrificans]SEN53436.1 chromate transporter [Brachymonas denitrificans DSM 15123]